MNRVRGKFLILFSICLTLVALGVVISFAVVNLKNSPNVNFSSATTKIYVDPPRVMNETLQAGSTFTVNVNVSGVNGLFAWQVNISWDSSILNVTTATLGNFLAGQPEGSYNASYIDNNKGYVLFGETTLGDHTGVTGNGTLVSFEFLVLEEYGDTVLNISCLAQPAKTALLDHMLQDIEFTTENGYFSNMFPGDIDQDSDVDWVDRGYFGDAYLSPDPNPNYNLLADLDGDGDVDWVDRGLFGDNYLRGVE